MVIITSDIMIVHQLSCNGACQLGSVTPSCSYSSDGRIYKRQLQCSNGSVVNVMLGVTAEVDGSRNDMDPDLVNLHSSHLSNDPRSANHGLAHADTVRLLVVELGIDRNDSIGRCAAISSSGTQLP